MTYSAEVLADTPLVYLRFGDASGTTAADTSGNSRSGTYVGTPTLAATGLLTGDADTAVTLNGTSQYATITGASWMNVTDYTIEVWFKGSTVSRFIASRDQGTSPKIWDVQFDASGHVVFSTFNAGGTAQQITSTATFNDNARHHAVCVKSGTTMTLYVDGASVATSSAFSVFNTSATQQIDVGRRGNNTGFFSGTLDEFAFYSTALSSTRAAAHYNAGIGAGDVTLAGAVSTLATAAPAGTVTAAVNSAGPVAAITVAAPSGTVTAAATVAGPVADVAITAPAGTVTAAATLAGAVAAITTAAPAGSVVVSSGVTLAGPTVDVSMAAPSGTVTASATVAGPVAAVTITAPAGAVTAGVTLTGAVVNLAIAAPAGTVATSGAGSVTLAGATATFTLTAPAGTVSAGITLSAPVATFRITALPGSINGELIPDTIDAYLYDATGKTQIAMLTRADQLLFRPEVSQRGNANLRIPLDDAGPVDFGGIVKFVWRGQVRFGCRINSEDTQRAADGRKWITFNNQPGLLSLLDQAFIEPEYGLKRTSSGDRHFGYASSDGPWRISTNWHTPRSVPWGQVGGRHFALPAGFTTSDNWIARSSPNTGVSASTQNWFVCDFTMASERDVKILAAGDNFLEMYMDGELIHPVDRTDYFAWRTASEIKMRLSAGAHRWAARVENTVPIAAFAGSPNPVGFIGNMFAVDNNGAITGSAIVRTNTTDWIVTDVTPGWRKGQVLKKLIEEAQARGVPGATSLTIGWTDTHDSDGQPWIDTPGEYTFSIGTVSLADVASQLGESGFNVMVDADSMTVLAYGRLGGDISASQTLALGEGGGVIDYTVTAASARATALLTHLDDGTWQETTDAPGIAAVGRIETGLQLGSASTPATAASITAAQLAESAHPQLGVTCQTSTLQGPQIYGAYGLGDSLTVPGRRASTMKGRCLAVTVKKVDGAVQVFPEFAEDRT